MSKGLKDYLEKGKRIVFFGGAGVSTESGIPDFRGTGGLYSQQYEYPPETILSHDFFTRNPEEFYRFYKDKLLLDNILPNRAHRALARLEGQGKLSAVITQNIDGLHRAAGSREVFELHGSVLRNYCLECGKTFGPSYVKKADGPPFCGCGGLVRPDVVLYNEQMDNDVAKGAIERISHADLLIIGGTSLNVYPAAGMVRYYAGEDIIIINKTPTPADSYASLVIRDPIGLALGEAVGVD